MAKVMLHLSNITSDYNQLAFVLDSYQNTSSNHMSGFVQMLRAANVILG